MIRRAHLALWCALVPALAACASLARNNVRRSRDPGEPAVAGLDGGTLPARWWTLFNDATLDRLIDEALRSDRDAALAVARVDEARHSPRRRGGGRRPGGRRRARRGAAAGGAPTSRIPPDVPAVRGGRRMVWNSPSGSTSSGAAAMRPCGTR